MQNKCGGFSPFQPVCLTIFPDPSLIPRLLPSLWPPTSRGRARERNAHCSPAFVPAGLQWGWAVCSLGQGLQIMTRRGLVDL